MRGAYTASMLTNEKIQNDTDVDQQTITKPNMQGKYNTVNTKDEVVSIGKINMQIGLVAQEHQQKSKN